MTTRFRAYLPAALFGVAIVLASCTCKIKEEQLSQIRQIRTQDKETAADISKSESEKARASSELASRQSEVRTCNDRLSFIQQKKAQWPNIWGDWDPNAPEVEPAPAPASQPKNK
ncbi:MAG: hypothetical protein RIR53_1825 [Bacteroidota bacterium]|jgi:septal ring factor EnvC (AmiA/AmiB activator)